MKARIRTVKPRFLVARKEHGRREMHGACSSAFGISLMTRAVVLTRPRQSMLKFFLEMRI